MNNIYIEFEAYIEKLKKEMLSASASFGIVDESAILRAPNKVGKRSARKNVNIINTHKYYLRQTEWAAFFHLVITLAKFFDDNSPNGKVTLQTMSSFVYQNRRKFNTKAFHEAYPDRKELIKSIRTPSGKPPKRIVQKKKRLQPFINRIIDYRNQLCHNLLDEQAIPTKYGEYYKLLSLIDDWIAYFNSILLKSSINFKEFGNQSRDDIRKLFNKL